MMQTQQVRPPAVAGLFYPAEHDALRETIMGFLRDAETAGPWPRALIVPHAGYAYSGAVAASGYVLLKPIRDQVHRVVLIGPSHRVSCYGLAASTADYFATPLGTVPVDRKSVEASLKLPCVHVLDAAHQQEHSLEVQLPFLQVVLGEFSLVPFTVGRATTDEVADAVELLWKDDTLIVISSDLSHYHTYGTARSMDSATAHDIEHCQWELLNGERACGYCGIRGLLKVAKARGLKVRTVDLRNSGDTAGSREQVVGYGSFVVH